AYRKHIKALLFYTTKLTGDYETMLLLQPNAPLGTPSMKPSTLQNFMRWRSGDQGTPLKDPEAGDTVIKSVLGEDVLCVGAWGAPTNIV
ncbi:unnamed protein product, partial [Heterosigma akashiwo]